MMRVLMSRSDSNHGEKALAIAFDPAGDRLAVSVGYFPSDPSRTKENAPCRVVLRGLSDDRDGPILSDRPNFVRAVAFSPDGRLIAAGVGDRTVTLWDSTTLEQVARLRNHTRIVSSLAFSPDGALLASGSADNSGLHRRGEFKLWDVANRAEIAHRDDLQGIWSVAFSPDGEAIALGSLRLTLCEVPTMRVRFEISLIRASARFLAFLDGGRRLACATGWELGIWVVESGSKVARGLGHKGAIHALAVSPDGRTLASGSADGTVRLWGFDPGSGRDLLGAVGERFQERACFDWGIGSVRSLAFSPDGSILAAGGSGANYLILWDLEV